MFGKIALGVVIGTVFSIGMELHETIIIKRIRRRQKEDLKTIDNLFNEIFKVFEEIEKEREEAQVV